MSSRSALILAYARPERILKQIELLVSKDVGVYLSLDGPRTQEVAEIQEVLVAKVLSDWSREVKIRRLPVNYGVGCAVISGIDWFFSEVEQGLIFEDDLVISTSAISFMEAGLERIKPLPKALLVSGSSFSRDEESQVRVSWTRIPLIWGWATTRDKWEIIRKLILQPTRFNLSGIKRPEIGYFQGAAISASTRLTDTWDSPLALRMLENSYYCLVPPVNFISNVGVDDPATHTSIDTFPLFNPIRDMNLDEIEFINPDVEEINSRDRNLFNEVFKVRQRHRITGILGFIRSREPFRNSLSEAVRIFCDEGESRTTLVLVHLGSKIPKYLIKNIRYLLRSNSYKIILISDSKIRKRQSRVLTNVRLWNSQELLEGWASDIKSNFRGGFWNKSKARLFVLMNFCSLQPSTKVLHIENDVWLSPGLNHKEVFEEGKIKFAKITNSQASGAIIYVGHSATLAVQALRRLLVESKSKTDMMILADFIDRFPRFYGELLSKPGVATKGIIFDPAMIGMHLFGEDPRNRFGKARLFAPYGEHGFHCNLWNFEEFKGKLLLHDENSETYEIANLHLHSKDPSLFNEDWPIALRQQIVKRVRKKGEVTIFKPKGMLLAMFDYVRLLPSYLNRKYLAWRLGK